MTGILSFDVVRPVQRYGVWYNLYNIPDPSHRNYIPEQLKLGVFFLCAKIRPGAGVWTEQKYVVSRLDANWHSGRAR